MQITKNGLQVTIELAQNENIKKAQQIAKKFATPNATQAQMMAMGRKRQLVTTYITDDSFDSTITVTFRTTSSLADIEQAFDIKA
jgi:hypothetical protein